MAHVPEAQVSDEIIESIRTSLSAVPHVDVMYREAKDIIKNNHAAALVYVHILYKFKWDKRAKNPYKTCLNLLSQYNQTPLEERKTATKGSSVTKDFKGFLSLFLVGDVMTADNLSKHVVDGHKVTTCTISGLPAVNLREVADKVMTTFKSCRLQQIWKNANYNSTPDLEGIYEIQAGKITRVYANKTGYKQFLTFLRKDVQDKHGDFLRQVGNLIGLDEIDFTPLYETVQLHGNDVLLVNYNNAVMMSMNHILTALEVPNAATYITVTIKPQLMSLGVPVVGASGEQAEKPAKKPRVEITELMKRFVNKTKGMRWFNVGWMIDYPGLMIILPWLKTSKSQDLYRGCTDTLLTSDCSLLKMEELRSRLDSADKPVFRHLMDFRSAVFLKDCDAKRSLEPQAMDELMGCF